MPAWGTCQAGKFSFRQGANAVIPKNVVSRHRQGRITALDAAKPFHFDFNGICLVDKVAQFHDCIGELSIQNRYRLIEFAQSIAIVSRLAILFVRIVQVGHQSYPHEGNCSAAGGKDLGVAQSGEAKAPPIKKMTT